LNKNAKYASFPSVMELKEKF